MPLRECPRCDARFRGDIRSCPIDGETLIAPSDPFIGTTIAGRYVVEELLGVGGMGSVYRARHQFIGRDVAPYPRGNQAVADVKEVGFVDSDRGDFRLAPGSRFKGIAGGRDPGADLERIARATGLGERLYRR